MKRIMRFSIFVRKKWENLLYYKILKPVIFLSKLGRTSIRGHADSGLNFDHMYKNKPKGVSSVGKFVDKILLNLPSVKATRNRKEVIVKVLANEIENNLILNRKTRIVDIASGPARYINELLDLVDQNKIEVLCLDKDKRALNYGKILAGDKPIRYAKADAMKLDLLIQLSKNIHWVPNIVLVSGLFEYKKDADVISIMKEVYETIEKDGLAIFISQTNNPTKKLMKKLGKTSENKRWMLRYRKPEVLRHWMLDIGFRGVIISVDRWDMYEFCTGRKH